MQMMHGQSMGSMGNMNNMSNNYRDRDNTPRHHRGECCVVSSQCTRLFT
jgi:hypothetical protein